MKAQEMKNEDPYNKAFFETVDKVEHVGEKAGSFLAKGSVKVAAVTVTGLLILIFGIVQFIRAFGRGLVKAQ